jgi:uroporphyrinogen decarboxylase
VFFEERLTDAPEAKTVAKNDLLLRAARREATERTPVWLMRQAGRFDPEYRALRDRSGLRLEEAFRCADHCAEISLLPKRFGVDAIIFFQDILTPLTPMGAPFVFRPGPILDSPVRTPRDVASLRTYDVRAELPFVADALRMVKRSLDGGLPLLGFAGAPLTLAFFLIEGDSPNGGAEKAQAFIQSEPRLCHALLEKLADMTAEYLAMQIEAGADAVQLFESVADLISREQYEEFAHPYHRRILSQLDGKTPTILFVKEQPFVDLMVDTEADVLSVGACVDLGAAQKRFGDRVAFQGNVDNRLLAAGRLDAIDRAVERCVEAGGAAGHILNLNHGLLRDTPVEHVQRLIETARTVSAGRAAGAADTRG